MSSLSFSLVLLIYWLTRSDDDCLTSQNDTAALYIRQLQDAIDATICELVNNTSYKDYSPSDGEEFDFIIVGAGSAGATLANRLSENPSWRVLLLEAGGDPILTSEIPAFAGLTWNTEIDWQYKSEPDPLNCLGSIDQRCVHPRGKTLGGSSSINVMLYMKGHPEDFDGWERMGNPGWGFSDMLPYFIKSEDNRVEFVSNLSESTKYHGVGGPLKVEDFRYDIDLRVTQSLSAGFKQMGINSYPDYDSEFSDGFFPFLGTLDNTRRCSTAKAFLLDYQTRPNLKISKNSLVVEILVDENNTAFGVSFTKNGTNFQVMASKEVVVSAGAVNSPQLLMLSGIGPRENLEEFGIVVKQNLRVGFNLQDHPMFSGFLITFELVNPPRDETEDMFQFLTKQRGPLTGLATLSETGFITTSEASFRNIQFNFHYIETIPSSSYFDVSEALGFNDIIGNSFKNKTSTKIGLIPAPIILRPNSRGRILLNSSNPLSYPLINTGYLHEEDDMKVILEVIEFMNSLVKTQPFLDLGARVERIDIPACNAFEFQTEDYWRCSIRHLIGSNNHLAGSCKMGPRGREDSVVDPELRVIGVTNLRVIDGSIMPNITSGNTNAPTIAIAEKGADLIKQAWD